MTKGISPIKVYAVDLKSWCKITQVTRSSYWNTLLIISFCKKIYSCLIEK